MLICCSNKHFILSLFSLSIARLTMTTVAIDKIEFHLITFMLQNHMPNTENTFSVSLFLILILLWQMLSNFSFNFHESKLEWSKIKTRNTNLCNQFHHFVSHYYQFVALVRQNRLATCDTGRKKNLRKTFASIH